MRGKESTLQMRNGECGLRSEEKNSSYGMGSSKYSAFRSLKSEFKIEDLG